MPPFKPSLGNYQLKLDPKPFTSGKHGWVAQSGSGQSSPFDPCLDRSAEHALSHSCRLIVDSLPADNLSPMAAPYRNAPPPAVTFNAPPPLPPAIVLPESVKRYLPALSFAAAQGLKAIGKLNYPNVPGGFTYGPGGPADGTVEFESKLWPRSKLASPPIPASAIVTAISGVARFGRFVFSSHKHGKQPKYVTIIYNDVWQSRLKPTNFSPTLEYTLTPSRYELCVTVLNTETDIVIECSYGGIER